MKIKKFDKQYTLSLDNQDRVIRSSNNHYVTRRKIPVECSFYMNPYKNNEGNKKNYGFSGNYTNSFSKITINDKLTIHSHGGTASLNSMSAEQTAKFLYDRGLREVGVLKLKSCLTGKEDFLIDLSNEMTKLGIKHGYICGMTNTHSDMTFNICNINLPILPYFPVRNMIGWKPSERFLSASKIVKGNYEISFDETRYRENYKKLFKS